MPELYNDAFDQVAAEYHRVRPGYPAEAIDRFAQEAGLATQSRLLELGAGTGKLTVEFARRGHEIDAVEPGPGMSHVAREFLEEYIESGQVRWIGMTALDAIAGNDLAKQGYDGIVVGTAYKWIKDKDGQVEAALPGLLRPGGYLGVFQNTTAVRDEGGGEFFDASREVFGQYEATMQRQLPWADELRATSFGSGFGPTALSATLVPKDLSAREYVDLISTYGPIVALEPEKRQGLARSVSAFIRDDPRFNGNVRLTHAVTLEMAQRAA